MFENIKWGDAPTWIAAIGAILTAIIYYRLLRNEIKKREEEQKQRSQYTPRRIATWYDGGKVIIKNAGDEPVYFAVVSVAPMGVKFDYINNPGNYIDIVLGTLGPGELIQELIPAQYHQSEYFPNIPNVAIEFTDCNGKHWRRESDGQFNQIEYRRPFD